MLFVLTISIIIIHSMVMITIYNGVKKVKKQRNNSNKLSNLPSPTLSVIIPFRNEEENLPQLISRIKTFKTKDNNVEFIFINDRSTDNSLTILKKNLDSNFQFSFQILSLDKNKGKKQALLYGINHAKHLYIAQIDADIIPSENWLNAIQEELKNKPDLLVLPVIMCLGKNKWFQYLEFSALQFITFGMAGNQVPLLCNGANLVYKKEPWLKNFEAINSGDSGDDLFLLQTFFKEDLVIKYVLNKSLAVFTPPTKDTQEFINQRVRWTGKNSKIKLPFYKTTMLYFGLIYLLPLVMALISWEQGVILFIGNLVIDWLIMLQFRKSLDQKTPLVHFILSALFMPLYLLFIQISTYFITPKWKGRKVKI